VDARERLTMVMDDTAADAATLDGQPFNGATLGRVLGEHLAMLRAIAASVLEVEQRVASLERTRRVAVDVEDVHR
jgi:hypothetical protein